MAETESLLSTCCIPSKHECITSFSIGRSPPPPTTDFTLHASIVKGHLRSYELGCILSHRLKIKENEWTFYFLH